MKDGLKVIVYDKNPGKGIGQWFLGLSWAVGAWLQKLFGGADEIHGFSDWGIAQAWLQTRETTSFASIQYWGHGSSGYVWMTGNLMTKNFFLPIKSKLNINSLIWFRTCSTFGGAGGHSLSKHLTDTLGCTAAGHTRVIGLLQGGLHTRVPNSNPSWPVEEGEFKKNWIPAWLKWGNNTITCFHTKIPKGW